MSVDFYKKLKPLKLPIAEVFHSHNFIEIPDDWHIIIADVKNSTAAVNEGRHDDVNLVAAGSLIVTLNVAKEIDIEVPFFFGGDGGTMIVPSEILNEVIARLRMHNLNSKKNFNLELHIGSISIKQIREAGYFIHLAKANLGTSFSKAVVVGDGLRYAEDIIKHAVKNEEDKTEKELNIDGLECRWDRIKPPAEEDEVVCYLVEATRPDKQIDIFRTVLLKIDEIYGSVENRNPLSLERLKLLLNFKKIKKEMLTRYGKWKPGYFTSNFLKTFLGKLYFKFNLKISNLKGKDYLKQLISNADILVIDGRINTIMTGTSDKRIKFLEFLTGMEKEDLLVYGHYISKESIMTCYIENRNHKHIHFVDGADGGYTEAAKELKAKLIK